jgi:hypothetical protein
MLDDDGSEEEIEPSIAPDDDEDTQADYEETDDSFDEEKSSQSFKRPCQNE